MKAIIYNYKLSGFIKNFTDLRRELIEAIRMSGPLTSYSGPFHGGPTFDTLINSAKFVFDDLDVYKPDLPALSYASDFDLELLTIHFNELHSDTATTCDCLWNEATRENVYKELLSRQFNNQDYAAPSSIYQSVIPFIKPGKRALSDYDLLLTPDPNLNFLCTLKNGRISADNIIAILAASGINICLPSISCNDDSVINELKTKFSEERQDYVNYLRQFVKTCYEGVMSGRYAEVWEYAEYHSNQDLLDKVHKFESAVKKSDAKLLERVKIGFVNGIPAVAQEILIPKGNFLRVACGELLKVLCKSIAEKAEYKLAKEQFPMASYIYEIKQQLIK